MIQARRRHNLPTQLTSFVGRARELAEVTARLGEHRLVTLTGAGGVGKTRLALEAAAAVRADYADGVWLVELAPVVDPAQVPREVAPRLGIELRSNQPPLALLREELADRELMLILDNCEHLVAACADLAVVLLRSCPGVRLMATSRERLGAPGEAVYVVPPLAAPDMRDAAHLTEIARYDAVQLVVERARLARPDFALTEDNVGAVTTICRELDGIPLAIELASARVRVLSVKEIAARLAASPFRLLTGDRGAPQRQQTLTATLDWSYELLSDPERALLRRLSVFVGGFELDAAEAICGGETVLDELTNLVDRSLVVAERRYRLLEPIRQYAGGKLAEAGESDSMRARHRDWYLEFAECAVAGMIAPDQLAWYARLDAEHNNLRAALEYSRAEPNPEAELRLVGALAPFWVRHWDHAEGRARIDDVLPRTEHVSSLAGRRARVQALDWRGYIEVHGDISHAERAVALARELGERALLATALRHLAFNPNPEVYGTSRTPRSQAQELLEEAVDCARIAGVEREVGYSLALLADLAYTQGDVAEAERLSTEALRILRQAGDRDALGIGLGISARIGLSRGDRERARKELEEAAAFHRELYLVPHSVGNATLLASLDRESGDVRTAVARFRDILSAATGSEGPGRDPAPIVFALAGIARLAADWGDMQAAVRLLGATVDHPAYRRTSAVPAMSQLKEDTTALRAALGEEAFAAVWAEGGSMSFDEVVAYALTLEPPATESRHTSVLTPREQEVARLIAAGRSNREIAAALVIAEPTAERHVANILSKLGVHTRAEIAAWHERQMNASRVELRHSVH